MKSPWFPLLSVLLTLTVAAPQPSTSQGLQFEIQGFAGGSFAVTTLSDGFFWGDAEFTSAQMDDGAIVGGSLGVRFGQFQLDGGVSYWPSTQVLVYPMPGVNGAELSVRGKSNVLVAGASVLYHFRLRESLIEPFVVAGGGVKSYSAEGDLADLLFVSSTNPMWNVGGGARFPISPTASLRVEVRDYMSMFDFQVEGEDPKLQHDLMATIGLSLITSLRSQSAQSGQGSR